MKFGVQFTIDVSVFQDLQMESMDALLLTVIITKSLLERSANVETDISKIKEAIVFHLRISAKSMKFWINKLINAFAKTAMDTLLLQVLFAPLAQQIQTLMQLDTVFAAMDIL